MSKQLSKLFSRIDDSSFRLYQSEIRRTNLSNLTAGSLVGMVLPYVLLLVSVLPFGILHMVYGYLSIAVIFTLYFCICKFVLVNKPRLILPIYYSFIAVVLYIAILMGSVWGKETNATTYLMLLIMFSLFIIDKPQRLLAVTGFMSVLFCVAVYFAKEHSIHNLDIINCIVFYIISVFVAYQVIKTRVNDITIKNQLKQQRDIDMLTNLYNRGSLERTVREYVHESNSNAVLIIMDLDNFKSVNDTLGHGAGDKLLQNVSDMLKSAFRPSDIVCRLGGDEFVVFLPAIDDLEVIKQRLDKLMANLNSIEFADNPSIHIGASIGIAQYPFHGCTFEELYSRADSALYSVKKSGKNGYKFYDNNIKPKVLVVDDVEIGRALLRESLKDSYEILEAQDGRQALDILLANSDISMVITDIQMPNMDGRELIKQIRLSDKLRSIPIIACTEYGNPKQVQELFAFGIDDFIDKPFSPTVIQVRVKNVFQSKSV